VARAFGDSADQRLSALAVDHASGEVAIAGTFGNGVLDFGGDAAVLDTTGLVGLSGFFARLDANLVGKRSFRLSPTGSGARIKVNGVAVDTTGRSAMVGQLSGPGGNAPAADVIPFIVGVGTLFSVSGEDAYLITLGPGTDGRQVYGGPG